MAAAASMDWTQLGPLLFGRGNGGVFCGKYTRLFDVIDMIRWLLLGLY